MNFRCLFLAVFGFPSIALSQESADPVGNENQTSPELPESSDPEPQEEDVPDQEEAPNDEVESSAKSEAQEAAGKEPPAETAAPAETEAPTDASVATSRPPVSDNEALPPVEAAPAETQQAAINPRPPGEEELLAPHPVDPESITFKPGTGLSFKSQDEKFVMAIRLRIQFRDELTSEGENGDKTLSNAFGIRRARLQFKGNVFSKYIGYKAEFALSPRDLSLQNGATAYTPLLSWYTDFTYLRDLSLRIGQYKLLYSRQRVVSSGDLEFVDRNIAQNEFNLDRDIGALFYSKDFLGLDLFRYYAGASIGEGRDVYEAEEVDGQIASYQLLSRLEALPFGDFEDYSEVDFERLNKVRLSLGVAYAYLKNGTRTRGYQGSLFADDGTVDYHNATADLMLKWAGMTIFSDFFYREGHRNTVVAPDDEEGNLARNGLGASVQVGYLIPKLPIGFGVRYGGVTPAGFDADETAIQGTQDVGATFGWYLAGHDLKLQADYFHQWSDSFSENAVDEGRVQLQVAY